MNDYTEETCTACNGSGEGSYDGSTCYSCKGSGVLFDEQSAIEREHEEAEYRYEQKKDAEIERHWNKGE